MGKTGKDQSGEKMGNQKKDLESINSGRRHKKQMLIRQEILQNKNKKQIKKEGGELDLGGKMKLLLLLQENSESFPVHGHWP